MPIPTFDAATSKFDEICFDIQCPYLTPTSITTTTTETYTATPTISETYTSTPSTDETYSASISSGE